MEYEHTYKITGTITHKTDSEKHGIDERKIKSGFDGILEGVEISRVRISPDRVIYECPTKNCNLRWIYRVGVDDPKLIPKICAYCRSKSNHMTFMANHKAEKIKKENRAAIDALENDLDEAKNTAGDQSAKECGVIQELIKTHETLIVESATKAQAECEEAKAFQNVELFFARSFKSGI